MSNSEFQAAQEAALRFGVSVRAIQKWAAAGCIPGAEKIGRSWFIPRTAVILEEAPEKEPEPQIPNSVPDVYQLEPFRDALPLMNARFPVGRCMDYIRAIPDQHDRNIALGEYYFFSGQAEESAKVLEPYLDSHDPALRYSAALLCTFANLARGHIHLARFSMGVLQTQVRAGLATDSPPKLHALGIFTATTASVLLHLPVPDVPPLEGYLRYLPGGIKLWACYVLAHKAYLEKDYSRSLSIADMSIALCPHDYPIAMIYLNLVSVMALMSLKRPEEALQRMDAAWKVAKPDGLIQPFGEHHGLLQGTIEIYFKKNAPEMLKPILDITYAFSATWRKFHNPDTNHEVADNLTTTEFTVAMLYNRDWSTKEISLHMDITEATPQENATAPETTAANTTQIPVVRCPGCQTVLAYGTSHAAPCGTSGHYTCDGGNHSMDTCGQHPVCADGEHGMAECGNTDHYQCDEENHQNLPCGHPYCEAKDNITAHYTPTVCGHFGCDKRDHNVCAACGNRLCNEKEDVSRTN